MTTFPVIEKFVSINGEGTRAGELSAFIRFMGCNLRCPYCDTKYSYGDNVSFEYLSIDDICKFAQDITNVTLTGGEPMIHDLSQLCRKLTENDHRVEIETNGSFSIEPLRGIGGVTFTLDYKLPSSGMEQEMDLDNYHMLRKCDTVKFVVGTKDDLIRACEIIDDYNLTDICHVYFSPVFGEITAKIIVDFMKKRRLNDVRLQLQLHKYIWDPQERGV